MSNRDLTEDEKRQLREQMPTSEQLAFRGLTNMRPPTELEVQLGIMQAMAGVVSKDAKSNPQALVPPERLVVAGSPVVVDADEVGKRTGWQKERPLELPPGQDIIQRLCDQALPHGPGFKKPGGSGDGGSGGGGDETAKR
jgi:hypothetical protein